MQEKRKRNTAGIGVLVAVLILCGLASSTVLFGRMISYTQAKFVNVMSLTEKNAPGGTDAVASDEGAATSSQEETDAPGGQTAGTGTHHPEFRMEAEAEIFRFSYDNETGKTTVIGVEGNPDKLIAPGTANLYQFTLQNPGDVSLDYILTMEAWVEVDGERSDLWLPVNARVWDYKNKYLLGSPDEMPEVLELNTVEESGELGAGRYAVYNLEWEWPFEWGDDGYDTVLGDRAVDEDIVLHIVIRTVAEYDEEPDDPNAGIKPPNTGDDSDLVLLSLLCVGSFAGLCVMLFAFFKSGRKEKQAE